MTHLRIEKLLGDFQSISLDEINSTKDSRSLLDRHDTKFVFSVEKLVSLLQLLVAQYQVLTIDKKRVFNYSSLYFDTDDYYFYHQHHNRALFRIKLRYRKYLDSNLCFFELKKKSNKGNTQKSRYAEHDIKPTISAPILQSIKNKLPTDLHVALESSKPKLWSFYSRVTLVNPKINERLTLDFDLSFRSMRSRDNRLGSVVVGELKQECLHQRSCFNQIAKQLNIYPTRFSKYCTGVALTEDAVKANRFKPRGRLIRKINTNHEKYG